MTSVPTTNISFYGNGSDGIWSIANPASPNQSNESLRDLLAYDYFHGPNGGNTVNFNGWGTYTGTSGTAGDSRIYGLSANGSNINYGMNLLSGLSYYYDGSTYKATMTVANNVNPPPGNDVNVNISFRNPFGSFPYLSGGGPVNPGPPSTFNLDNAGSPLILQGFWYLTATTNPPFTGTAPNGFTMSINGNSIFSTTLGAGVNNYSNNWTNYGTIQQMANYGGSIGFTVDININ